MFASHFSSLARRTACRKFLSTATKERPFKILGVQQIAIGSAEKAPLKSLWYDIFGLEAHANKVLPKENVDEDIVKCGPEPFEVEVDLMTPIDVDKSPKVHMPPLNHIGLWVDDLPVAVEWMKSEGVRFAPGGIREGAAGYDITFIHPKGNEESPISGNGVLVELVQAPNHVIEAFNKASSA